MSIGILAWNESQEIAATIASLAGQSLFGAGSQAAFDVEIVCVPNGCEDDTAAVAAVALDRCFGSGQGGPQYRVESIEAPGKSNAWNQYVHEFARPDADYIILMDADIAFVEASTLLNLIRALEAAPEACVSIDRPVKDIEGKPHHSVVDWLSLRASRLSEGVAPRICGQLYCARGDMLRRLYLPAGLTTQDSFLTAMVRTDLLTREADDRRIVRAECASHIFEAYTSIGAIFRHQRAISIGTTINVLLVEYLQENLNGETVGAAIRRWSEEDPDWFAAMIRRRFDERGWWVIPCRLNLHRARMLQGRGLRNILAGLPVVLAGLVVDTAVALSANFAIHRNESGYYWEKSREQ